MNAATRNRYKVTAVVFALVATGAMAAGQIPKSERDRSIAIVHATVIDGTGAAARPNQTVVIMNDRITAVGAFGGVSV